MKCHLDDCNRGLFFCQFFGVNFESLACEALGRGDGSSAGQAGQGDRTGAGQGDGSSVLWVVRSTS